VPAACPMGRSGTGTPAGRAADSAGTTWPAAEDHDRIARNITEVTDVVVCRLYSAGLVLKTALELMDGHRAATTSSSASTSWTR